MYIPRAASASDYIRLKGAVHMHTSSATMSGKLTAEELVATVARAGLDVAVITDHDNMRVEYGQSPLRGLIKKTVDEPSIDRYGPAKYLEDIRRAGEKYPGVLVIPGTEAVPAYYWQGSYLGHDLVVRNWHRHMLVVGMDKPEDYANLPSVGEGFPRRPSLGCITAAWPLATTALGLWLVRIKRRRSVRAGNQLISGLSRPYLAAGITVLAASALFLMNNFPFCPREYDQYHGDQGYGPYQSVIDYARAKGALTFWAHPDASMDEKYGGIHMVTRPYPEALIRTRGYTGFSAFQEGEKRASVPGGTWDVALLEYCRGRRAAPVWAIGEVDYKQGDWMADTQTVFFVKEKTTAEVLRAMREGRMYAVTRDGKPELMEFGVKDEHTGKQVGMGGTAFVGGPPEISVSLTLPGTKTRIIKLVRDGRVIKTFEALGAFNVSYKDEGFPRGRKGYYRLAIDGSLLSNPVFVDPSGGHA